jgi:hypothetical protein
VTKYRPIQLWLSGSMNTAEVATFAELENILGFLLPRWARTHWQWWGNEHVHHRHTHCRAWLDAGFETEGVDIDKETLVFRGVKSAAMDTIVSEKEG